MSRGREGNEGEVRKMRGKRGEQREEDLKRKGMIKGEADEEGEEIDVVGERRHKGVEGTG